MKKIFALLLVFVAIKLSAQGPTFLPPRSSSSTTVQDSRWRGLLTVYLPHTHGLTLNGGLDTLGAVFYDDSSRHIWYRDTVLSGGHVFSMLLKTGDAGQGTVMQVNAGFWMVPVSITTTGTISADSAAMAAYFPRRKDSTVSFVTPTQMNAQGFLKTISGINAGGDLSGTYPNPTIATNAVSFGKFQQIAAFSFVGNPTASPGNAQSSFFGYGLRWNNDSIKVDTSLLKSVFGSATAGINQLTGDGTAGPGAGSQVFTLATVNGNVFGSNTFLKFSVNGKGLVTGAATVGSSDITGALGYTPIQLSSLTSTLPIIYNNSTGNISMANSGVTATSYTNANITVDAFGRITAASNGSGGTGGTNSNVGSGYRFAVVNTNNIKSLFCVGCTLDSTSNANALTLTVTGGSGINQLTGDGTAGPGTGSQALTLATVNGNVGSFGSASSVGQFTANGKGLITAAASVAIQITESQVTNLTTDLSGKQSTITSSANQVIYNNAGTLGGNNEFTVSLTGTQKSISLGTVGSSDTGTISLGSGTGAGIVTAPGTLSLNSASILQLQVLGLTKMSFTSSNIFVNSFSGSPGIVSVNSSTGVMGKVNSTATTLWGTDGSGFTIPVTVSSGLSYSGGVLTATGGIGNANSNIGSGFRLAVPNTNNIKTLFCVGCTLDSTTNANALTLTVTGGSGITQLTGDGTAGPGSGSQAFTLATVNGNVGSFGTATQVSQLTVNAKGLITAAANVSILITESQVTNLTTDLAAKQGLLSNLGAGYRLFSPQTGMKTLFCTGCTLDSATTGQIGITVTGGGGGITQIKARNPLFTVGTDSIALDTLRAPEIPYGNIYTRNGTFSANELVAVGNAAFTVNAAGNVVVTSGNSGTNANYIRLQNIVDEVTQLPRFSRTMYFQANGTGTGIAVGTVKTGVRQSVGDVAAWVNLAASPLQFAIGNTSPTILTNSGSYVNGPTWTTGDSIKVVLTFSDSVAVATVQNVTTNSAVTTLTYNFVTSSSPFLPQISYWAWITFGGQQTIYSEADSSTSVKDPNELLAGTSKTAAYYATNFANRLGWQVGQSVPSSVISAGGSNMTNDYSRVFPQNLNQNPIYFLIEEPCNDIRVGYGGSLAQAEKTVDSMITVCKTRGVKFLLYGLPEDSTVTGPAGNAAVGLTVMDLYFRNKYPQNYINTWDSLVVTPGSDNRLKTAYYITDGIHPNGAAQTVIARIIARSLTYYKNRQANILNTDGLIQVSNGGYASLNAKAVAAAIVGGGTVNVLPKYLASGGLTPSGFSDDGSTEFGAGSWYTTPVLKAGPSHAVTASLYTMSFGSSFTNWYTRMPGGGTNDKIWGFNNNGGTFSGAKLTDGGSAAFTWLNVASSGTTLSTIALQGRTLINGATDDASTGLQISGGGRADKFGVNTAPVTDSWLILAAGTTSVSPIRLTVGPLKTTTFGGTILYGSGADTSLYVGITRNALNVLTRVALVDSSAILTGQIAFANSSRYYTGDNNFKYTVAAGMVLGNNLQLSAIVRKLLDTTTYKPTVVDGSGNMFKTDWATFGGGSQTWQQGLTTGSTLNTTNTVTNTGQSFTWNNGGTGTFKFSGILTDTTNAAYVLFKKKDSSVAEMTFANFVAYLPSDTLNADNGLVISGSGLNHTISLIGSKGNRNVYGTDGSGNASWTDPVSFSGSWTVSASTNVSTVSLTQIVFSRNGLMIHVTLSGSVTATLTATASAITVNLPSGLQAAATTSLSGFGEINPTGISIAGAGVSVTSSSTALIQFVSTSTSSVSWVVSFDYYSN